MTALRTTRSWLSLYWSRLIENHLFQRHFGQFYNQLEEMIENGEDFGCTAIYQQCTGINFNLAHYEDLGAIDLESWGLHVVLDLLLEPAQVILQKTGTRIAGEIFET
jgi:hypothetical protein